jgi:hypothetical protein
MGHVQNILRKIKSLDKKKKKIPLTAGHGLPPSEIFSFLKNKGIFLFYKFYEGIIDILYHVMLSPFNLTKNSHRDRLCKLRGRLIQYTS